MSLALASMVLMTGCDDEFGGMMAEAGYNTLLGMGTVFVVLVLMSLIISLFGVFFGNKSKKTKTENKSVDNTIAQIIEKEEQEELSDDLELVAVISAAIAAYEGSASTEGYVVKSIKKSKNWRNA